MFKIIKKSLKAGVVTGNYPAPAAEPEISDAARKKAEPFQRSLTIREVDTGSCNGCEMEMNALMNPVYDAERFGIHIAASPRHADVLVVTGPVERHIPVDVKILGCPPRPGEILNNLLALMQYPPDRKTS